MKRFKFAVPLLLVLFATACSDRQAETLTPVKTAQASAPVIPSVPEITEIPEAQSEVETLEDLVEEGYVNAYQTAIEKAEQQRGEVLEAAEKQQEASYKDAEAAHEAAVEQIAKELADNIANAIKTAKEKNPKIWIQFLSLRTDNKYWRNPEYKQVSKDPGIAAYVKEVAKNWQVRDDKLEAAERTYEKANATANAALEKAEKTAETQYEKAIKIAKIEYAKKAGKKLDEDSPEISYAEGRSCKAVSVARKANETRKNLAYKARQKTLQAAEAEKGMKWKRAIKLQEAAEESLLPQYWEALKSIKDAAYKADPDAWIRYLESRESFSSEEHYQLRSKNSTIKAYVESVQKLDAQTFGRIEAAYQAAMKTAERAYSEVSKASEEAYEKAVEEADMKYERDLKAAKC